MDKIDKLEQAIMKISAESQEVETQLKATQSDNQTLQNLFESLLNILEEKGIVNTDDLEDEIHSLSNQKDQMRDHFIEQELERIKKVHH